MKQHGIRLMVLACVWLLFCRSMAGQRVTASIEGRVADETGTPIAGVAISAVNRSTGFQRLTTSDQTGRFALLSLPVEGAYVVRAEASGFAAAVREGVELRPDQALVIDFRLRVAAQVAIAVGATDVQLDRTRAVVQQTVAEDLIRALPVPGRGFMTLASLAAGFTGHPDFPNPHGQVFWTNNVLVDGGSHFSKWRTAPRSFFSGVPLEAVQQVQVLTALFSAEFGEGLASVTSTTTKAGTNEWHGSGLIFARNAALDAAPAFSVRKPSGNGQHYGISFGGPLAVDRSHVFGAYEGRRARDRNIVVSPASPNTEVPDTQDEQLLFLRIDHQRGGQLLSARYNGEIFRWRNQPGGLVLPASGTKYTTDVHTLLLTGGIPRSIRTLHELRFQFSRYVHRRWDLEPAVFVSRAGYSIEGGALGPAGFDADPEDAWEASDTLWHARATHSLRVGGGFKHVRARTSSLSFGRGAYFFAGSPDRVAEPFLFMQSLAPSETAVIAKPRSVSLFGFFQTDWAIHPDVRLNLGLRYDVERVSNVRGYDVPVDTDNLQPRLGAVWDVNGQGRTVVRGGVGLYTQQHLLYPINRVQLEGVDGAMSLTLTPASPFFPRFPRAIDALPGPALPPRDIHRVEHDFGNPYALQAAGGVQRLLAGGVLAADYVYLHGRDLMSLVDANAPAPLAKPATRTVTEADATRPIPATIGTFRKMITLGNLGRSWYHALEVRYDRIDGPVRVLGAYTLSRARDMANYELPEDSHNLSAEKARATADVPHNVVAALDWTIPGARLMTRGWSLSGIGTYRSHRPYTISWGDDRNGTTQNDARPGGRNTGRTGPYRTIDLALNKRFQWHRGTVDARVQAFNLLNATNYNQYVGELVSPLFGRPVTAFAPRRIELAAIVRF
jgi:hypothetical protein